MARVDARLTIDRYAEIRAEMESGALRDEALSRAGLSVDEWTAAQRQWLESMGAEIALGRFELTHRYTKAFLDRQRVITEAREGARAASSEAPREGAPLVDPAPRAGEAKPTYLIAAAAPAPSKEGGGARSPFAGTMNVDLREIKAALPFDPRKEAPATAPPLPPTKRAPAPLSGTSMAIIAPRGPLLPFGSGEGEAPKEQESKGPTETISATMLGIDLAAMSAGLPFSAGATPAPQGAPSPKKEALAEASRPLPPADSIGATTLGIDVSMVRAALPFPAEAKSPPVPARPVDSPPPNAPHAPPGPPVTRAPAAFSGTSLSLEAHRAPALPFGDAAPAPPTSDDDDARATQVAPLARAPRPRDEIHATGEISADLVAKIAQGTMPFQGTKAPVERAPEPPPSPEPPAPPPAAPSLTLQQYAALCAELSALPDRAEATFERYGLANRRDRLTVDLQWQDRLRRNPAEYQAWQALFQRWREHFEPQKPAS